MDRLSTQTVAASAAMAEAAVHSEESVPGEFLCKLCNTILRGPVKIKGCGCVMCLTCARDTFDLSRPSPTGGKFYCSGCRELHGFRSKRANDIYDHMTELADVIDRFIMDHKDSLRIDLRCQRCQEHIRSPTYYAHLQCCSAHRDLRHADRKLTQAPATSRAELSGGCPVAGCGMRGKEYTAAELKIHITRRHPDKFGVYYAVE